MDYFAKCALQIGNYPSNRTSGCPQGGAKDDHPEEVSRSSETKLVS